MGVVPRLVLISEKAGKYIEIEKGPMAVRMAISGANPLGTG
jgi:hypothetical protein